MSSGYRFNPFTCDLDRTQSVKWALQNYLGSPNCRTSLLDELANPTMASLILLLGTLDTAYRGAPYACSYDGTRTALYTMDTAYQGSPMVVAVNG